MHSTRGRARPLFEILQGDPLTGGWRNEHVREALDLCLSCKGCKSDCPVNVGEHELLPRVRQAAKETLIIADGFSCCEQIAQTTNRRALHLAQVIHMGMHQHAVTPVSSYPEAAYRRQTQRARPRPALTTAACVGAGALVAGGLLVWALRRWGLA
jgi:L-lactate utilization protein LutB